jgi:hypothetical protein
MGSGNGNRAAHVEFPADLAWQRICNLDAWTIPFQRMQRRQR